MQEKNTRSALIEYANIAGICHTIFPIKRLRIVIPNDNG